MLIVTAKDSNTRNGLAHENRQALSYAYGFIVFLRVSVYYQSGR